MSRIYMKRPVADRFWEKVRRGKPDECWFWIAAGNTKGYGTFGFNTSRSSPSTRHAHTIAWELSRKRSLPEGKVVRHRCDVPLCCNPKHLLLGTQKQNIHDMIRRGRAGSPESKRHLGEAHGRAKLTNEQVLEIRASVGVRLKDVAARYGVSLGTVENIRGRKTWRHLLPAED